MQVERGQQKRDEISEKCIKSGRQDHGQQLFKSRQINKSRKPQSNLTSTFWGQSNAYWENHLISDFNYLKQSITFSKKSLALDRQAAKENYLLSFITAQKYSKNRQVKGKQRFQRLYRSKSLAFSQSLHQSTKLQFYTMQDKLQAISKMQELMGKEGISPQQKIIAAIHAINRYHKLECLNEKGEQCEIPQNWKQKESGQYRFAYTGLQKGGKVIFKFRQVEEKVVVAFGYEGQKQVTKVTFDKNETIQEIVKKYEFNLNQFLTNTQPNIGMKPFYHYGNLESKNIQKQSSSPPHTGSPGFISNIQKSYPPKDVMNPHQTTNPFGQEEYVGPNSQIFNNPYFQQTHIPISQKIPIGARYDPVDPFDNPYQDKRDNPDDFVGFDQFGVPIDPSKMSKKPPKYNPLGGSEGGLGGSFGSEHKGGFGGGLGPII